MSTRRRVDSKHRKYVFWSMLYDWTKSFRTHKKQKQLWTNQDSQDWRKYRLSWV